MKTLTFDDFPKDIAEALKRADAWGSYSDDFTILTITSRNLEQPLTNAEKIRITKYLYRRKEHPRKVSFREGKAPFQDLLDREVINK